MGLTRNVSFCKESTMKIEPFLESLSTQTASSETLRAYRQDLNRFADFLKSKRLRVNQVKPTTIHDFIKHMCENAGRTAGSGLASSTVSRRLSAISAYYDWLNADGESSVPNPVRRIKRPKVRNEKARAADDTTLATLVDGITDERDRAIVLILLYSGLRLGELRQLDKTSITVRRRQMPDGSVQYFGSGEVVGKGRKRRSFLVGPRAMQAIANYIANARTKDELRPLFLSSRGQRLSSRAIQQIVHKWCQRLGLPHLHVHQFRHSFATRSVNAGMSAAVLQELMGHASLTTTQRYFRMKPERLSREYFSVMEFVREFSPV
jgi:site-specific recombinase XerD